MCLASSRPLGAAIDRGPVVRGQRPQVVGYVWAEAPRLINRLPDRGVVAEFVRWGQDVEDAAVAEGLGEGVAHAAPPNPRRYAEIWYNWSNAKTPARLEPSGVWHPECL